MSALAQFNLLLDADVKVMANWYYGVAGEQNGPVDDNQMRNLMASGRINATTIIWREGMANWQPMGEVPEWRHQLVSSSPSPYLPPHSPHTPHYAPLPVVPNSGMAIASLVCGIGSIVLLFSCFLGILAGIPAVVCGHMALKQIGESEMPVAGRGMAIAGLVTGYLTIAVTVCAGAVFGIMIARDMP